MKKIILTFVLSVSIFFTKAQSSTYKWAFGIHFGTCEYFGDLGSEFGTLINNHGMGGFNISKYLNRSFDGTFRAALGTLDFEGRKGKFDIDVWDYNLMLRYKFHNGYILKENASISPYLQIGAGITYSNGSSYRNASHNAINPSFPAGFGIRLRFSERVSVHLLTQYKYVLSDSLDGNLNSQFENNFHDQFLYHSVGITFNLGKADRDKDGIKDKHDQCPDLKGTVKTNGCPDADKDGVRDSLDQCPDVFGTIQGCPDKDDDGVADKDDNCPDLKGDLNGCPDSDKDGVADKDDPCPNEYGEVNGCKDSDKDGIIDKDDDCPELAGKVKGCPDSDNDGVADKDDPCPEEAGSLNGCKDSDNDGVADKDDKCPNQAGKNGGCPEIKKEEQEVLERAMKGVFFKSGSAIIKTESFDDLDAVYSIMQNNPKYKLSIEGHTDNVGNSNSNLILSKDRAEAARTYLINKGIDSFRITAIGYGDSRPIADNDSLEGRKINRRVEFKLVP